MTKFVVARKQNRWRIFRLCVQFGGESHSSLHPVPPFPSEDAAQKRCDQLNARAISGPATGEVKKNDVGIISKGVSIPNFSNSLSPESEKF